MVIIARLFIRTMCNDPDSKGEMWFRKHKVLYRICQKFFNQVYFSAITCQLQRAAVSSQEKDVTDLKSSWHVENASPNMFHCMLTLLYMYVMLSVGSQSTSQLNLCMYFLKMCLGISKNNTIQLSKIFGIRY